MPEVQVNDVSVKTNNNISDIQSVLNQLKTVEENLGKIVEKWWLQ